MHHDKEFSESLKSDPFPTCWGCCGAPLFSLLPPLKETVVTGRKRTALLEDLPLPAASPAAHRGDIVVPHYSRLMSITHFPAQLLLPPLHPSATPVATLVALSALSCPPFRIPSCPSMRISGLQHLKFFLV